MSLRMVDLVVSSLIAANCAGRALNIFGFDRLRRTTGGMVAAVLMLLPLGFFGLGWTSLGGVFISIFGSLSAATIVLTAIYAAGLFTKRLEGQRPSRAFLMMIAIAGLLLYPASAGMTTFDPYDLGFRGWPIPVLMMLVAIAGWVCGAFDVACWIALSALLYLMRIHGSHNLWDYLLDPFAMLAAVGMLAGNSAHGMRWRVNQRA